MPQGEVNVAYAPNVPPPQARTARPSSTSTSTSSRASRRSTRTAPNTRPGATALHGDNQVTTGTPGPIIRARVGDILRFTLTNDGAMPHNVDFHAVTGQGGGAKDLTVAPGQSATIEARLLYPGIFMYHCAAGDVPMHISQGMYGGILVDPATPLPAVEHELYMVQSEYYTTTGADGTLTTDRKAITDESPDATSCSTARSARSPATTRRTCRSASTMRIYFINAGLNLDSNFHPIGSHWDSVWEDAALLNAPLRGIQTTLVPAGGGTVVELIAQVPMTIVLVDHALARAFDKGAIGQIVINGDPNPEIFQGFPAPRPSAPSASPSHADAVRAVDSAPVIGCSVSRATAPRSASASCPASGTFQADGAADEFADAENPR